MTTYTPIARLPIMTPADVAVRDAWGLIVNQAMSAVEQTAAGYATIDLTGLSTYTPSVANDAPDQARQAMLLFTGAPNAPGPCSIIIPSVARVGWVSNQATLPITLGTSGAAVTLTVPSGSSFLYRCDGSTVTATTIGTSGVLQAGAGLNVNNGSFYSATDATGTTRGLLGIGTDNWTDLFIGGAAGWRVLNQAGTTALVTISQTGNMGVLGTLTAAGNASIAGNLTVGGTTTFTGPQVYTGSPAFSTTVSGAAGFTTTATDAGGLNFRMVAGNYGVGWRNDGLNTYLLMTASGAQTGIFNALRPFSVNNGTGAVVLDSTGAGISTGGALTSLGRQTATDQVLSSGQLYMENARYVTLKDAAGVYRISFGMTPSNLVEVVAGAVGFRVINQAYTTALLNIDQNGNVAAFGIMSSPNAVHTVATIGAVVFAGGGAINTAGTLSAANCAITIGSIGAVVFAGGGSINTNGNIGTAGILSVTGGTPVSGTGGYLDHAGAGVSGGYTINAGIVAQAGVVGAGFYAASDGRMKTELADLTPADGYDWVMRGRPRSYVIDGRFAAGFIAQEDIAAGRGAAVQSIADDRPLFAEGDGYAAPGTRLLRRYEHDIAYLTAALQGALARIDALEGRAA